MKNLVFITLISLILTLPSFIFADTLSPTEYGLFQLDYALKQIHAVDNEMFLFEGWRNEDKDAWAKASKYHIEELNENKREIAKQQIQIKDFASLHKDFEQFRPIMHKLSLDPKNYKMTLQELYDEAKRQANGTSTEINKDKVVGTIFK